MYCKNCKKEFEDDKLYCPNCGERLIVKKIDENKVIPLENEEDKYLSSTPVNDSGSFGWIIFSIILFYAGFVLRLGWMNEKPKNDKKLGIGLLIGLILRVLIGVIFTFIYLLGNIPSLL